MWVRVTNIWISRQVPPVLPIKFRGIIIGEVRVIDYHLAPRCEINIDVINLDNSFLNEYFHYKLSCGLHDDIYDSLVLQELM